HVCGRVNSGCTVAGSVIGVPPSFRGALSVKLAMFCVSNARSLSGMGGGSGGGLSFDGFWGGAKAAVKTAVAKTTAPAKSTACEPPVRLTTLVRRDFPDTQCQSGEQEHRRLGRDRALTTLIKGTTVVSSQLLQNSLYRGITVSGELVTQEEAMPLLSRTAVAL